MTMISLSPHRRCASRIARHFGDGQSRVEEQRMRRHLQRCGRCRAAYLAWSTSEGDGTEADQRRHERLGRALFGPPPAPATVVSGTPARWLWAAGAAAAAACAVILLTVALTSRGPLPGDQPAFRAKGSDGGSGATASDRFVSISVFRRDAAGQYQPAGRRVAPGQGLAFGYTNRSDERFDRLLIFGVDEGHRVYWFYPGWEDPRRDPAAIAIGRGADLKLPDEVSHRYQGRRLRIFALFCRRALKVRQIEAVVARHRSRGESLVSAGRFPLADCGQHSVSLEVGK